jgi:hypothetical protein
VINDQRMVPSDPTRSVRGGPLSDEFSGNPNAHFIPGQSEGLAEMEETGYGCEWDMRAGEPGCRVPDPR